MKKNYFVILLLLALAIIWPPGLSTVEAQTYTYTDSKSNLNVGNPGSLRTVSDFTTTGGTNIHPYNSGPGGTTGAYNPANYWSVARALPFNFKFYGADVDSFCVSKNGLLTFNTSVAGTLVNSTLNTNRAMPYSNLPDSTIAYFWENNATLTRGSNDNVWMYTYGTSPNRQVFIQNFSYRHGTMSFSYFAVVLEETTNKIYVVDMNYKSGNCTSTVGVQLNSSTAVQYTTGLNSTAGSPSIVMGTGGSAYTDNEYYILTPKLLVQDDITPVAIANPAGVICAKSDSIKVEIKNEGTNTVTQFDVKWKVNGVSQTTYSWTGSVASGASVVVNLGPHTYPSGADVNFEFETALPNGNADKNTANDIYKETKSKGISGTVTVAATGADYTTVQGAIDALEKAGICGPVVVKVAAGTYTEHVRLGKITGTSSTNTVTFQGAGAASTKITYRTLSSTEDRATVTMDGSDNIIFRDMTIENTGTTYGWAVHFFKNTSNCKLIKCTTTVSSTSTSGNIQNIVMSNNVTGYSSSGHLANNITIDSCTIIAGYMGVVTYGTSSTLHENLTVTNCTFTNQYYYGLYVRYAKNVIVKANTVSLRTSNSFGMGMYFYYLAGNSTSGSTVGSIIENNVIAWAGRHGMYIGYCQNPSADKGRLVNNMVMGASGYNYTGTYWGSVPAAVHMAYGGNWDVYHNTLHINGPAGNGYAFTCYSTANYDVRNNIFSVGSSFNANARAAYFNFTPSSTRMSDYNAYYNGSRSTLMYAGGNRTSSTLNTYSSNGDQNSVVVEPPFISSTNLHLSDACFPKGATITSVMLDIDGQSRASSPHIGADEIPVSSLDAGIAEILTPKGIVTSGSQLVRVAVKNFGSTSLTGVEVKYQVGSSSTVTESITFAPSLGNCMIDTIDLSNSFTHTTGCDEISVWTEDPNSSTDQSTGNDKMGPQSFGVPMSGTFTVGGTSPDFVDIASAVLGLKCAGVNGAVVINVRSGTYTVNEELSSADIPGISATNSVIFQSDATNTMMPVLQYSATGTADNYIFKFNNMSYITFDGLHLKANGGGYARVVEFFATNSNIEFKNCKLEGQEVTTTSNAFALVYDNTGTTNMSSSITFTNNTFMFGSYGMYVYGGSSFSLQSGWSITKNTFTNFYYYGAFFYYMNNLIFDDNKMSTNTVSTFGYGTYFRYCDGAMSIQRNSITGLNGGYGMYMYYCDATSTNPAIIANNYIEMGNNGTSSGRGIYAYYAKHNKFYFNTINMTSSYYSTLYSAGYFYFNSTTYAGNELKNNNFISKGYALYLGSSTSTYIDSDYNNIWSSRSGNFIYINFTNYNSVSAYSTATSLDGNSLSSNPLFVSAGKADMLSQALDSAGTALSVTNDIYGNTRRASNPSIGAVEYEIWGDDCGITAINQPTVACSTNEAIVTVTNFGSNTLTSATIQWTVDGVPQSSSGFVGSLALGRSAQVNLGTFTTTGSGPFVIRAWTILPNAKVDPQPGNDSASTSISLGMAGTFTVGTATSDYPTIPDAIAAVETQGLCGPVVFKVAPGTYTGAFEIKPIVGSSTVNTVTFEPASGVVKWVNAPTSSSSNYVVRFSGADNIILKNLTLQNNSTFSSYSRVIEFRQGNNGITITGCTIIGRTDVFTTSTFAHLIYDNTGTANMTNNLTITGCSFSGGSDAIYLYGGNTAAKQQNIVITNNTISDFYYYGIYCYYSDSTTINGNTIRNSTVAQAFSCYGIYCGYNNGIKSISNNDVSLSGSSTNYVLYMWYCGTTAGDSSLVTNNILAQTNSASTGSSYVGYLYNCSNIMFAHNNCVNMDGATLSNNGTGLYTYTASSFYGKLHFYNNIYAAANVGSIAVFHNLNASTTWFSQHNNYIGTYLGAYSGFAYTTISDFQTATGKCVGAVSMNPLFTSLTNLHTNNINLMKAGKGVGVMTDILADTRDATTPTIGAHEIDPEIELVSITSVPLSCGAKSSAYSVEVTVKNNGDIDLVDIPMELQVNGGTIIHDTIRTGIASGVTTTFTFTQTIDISGLQDYTIKVTANSVEDVLRSNDSKSLFVPYWPVPKPAFTFSETCLGASVLFDGSSTFTGSTVSTYTVTYTWDFGDGNTGAGEDPSHAYASNGTYKVVLTATSNNGCKDTVSHMLTISDMTPGSIAGTTTICSGTVPNTLTSVTLAGGSDGAYTYQWQTSTNGTTWTDVSGATGTDYTPGALSTQTMYRREANSVSGCGPVYSNTVTISIFSAGVAGTVGSDQTICYNTAPGTLSEIAPATGGDGNYTYQWQWSTDNVTFSNVSGATNADYTSGNLTKTTYFRRVDNSCNDDNTNTITVTVHNKLVAGTIAGNQTVCPNGVPSKFTETGATAGGDGTYTFQWQSSTDKVIWTDISGANASEYQAGAIATNTWFRRSDISGSGCGDVATQPVLVEVAPLPVPDFVLATHCFGDPMPITNQSSISSGAISSYKWDLGDGTSSTAQVPVHTYSSAGTYTVKLVVTSRFGCKDSTTRKIKISSIPTPTFNNFYDCATDSMRFKNTTITSCGSITGFFWDFGDGSSSNSTNPSHKYATAGTYNVKLRITVPGGFTDSTTRSVTIETPGTADFTANDVCFGEDVTFTNNSLNAVSYSWDFGDNTASTTTGPTHFYRVTGKYTVKLHVTDGNGCVNTVTKQVEVKVKPFADFTTDNRCDGKEVPFVNGTLYADSYLWDFGDLTTSTVKNPNHVYPAAATYNVTLYADNVNGCKDTTYGTVDVYNNPVASFTAADGCDGHAISFTNGSTGSTTYEWNFGDANTSTVSSPSHMYPTSGVYAVSMVASSIQGCTDTATTSITVNPSPVVGFTANTACDGEATVFANTSTLSAGTMTYSWDFGDGNSSTSMSPSHSYAAAGKYSVTLSVTGSNGNCTESMTKTITVNPSPTAGFATANVCDGSAVSFTNSSTGAATYMWDFGDGNTASSAAPSHTYASAGTYTVMLTVNNAYNCKSSTTQSIVVYDEPAADFTSSTECLGDATTFTNASTIGGTGSMTYTWDFGDGSSSNADNPTHTYSSAGNYVVTLTATSNNNCSHMVAKNVIVHDVPVAHFTTGNVCVGQATPFTNNSIGGTSYSWDFGDGSGNSSARAPSHTYAQAGSYAVRLTVTNAQGCTHVYGQTAVVWDKPTANFSQTDVCKDAIMSFTNSSSAGTYSWNFGDGYVSSSTNPTHIYKRSGTFNVNLHVVNNFGCVADVTKPVTVYAEPVAAFNAPDVCAGTNASFTNMSAGASSYSWRFGDGGTSTATNPTHSYASGGTYSVRLEATNTNGCTNEVVQSIRINPKPRASFTAGNTCIGSPVVFSNTSDAGSYTWDFGDGTGSSRPSATHTYSASGTYTATLTVVNEFGCTNSASRTITISPKPVADFAATATCTGPSASFTNNSSVSSGTLTYNWDFGDGSMDASANPTKTYAKGGNYFVTLSVVSSNGCQASAEKTVTVYDLAKANFTAESVCEGESVVFINTSEHMTSASWDLGDGNSSNKVALSHKYASVGNYNVKLTVKNPIGCESSVVNTVRVSANPTASFTAPDACEKVNIAFNNSSTGAAAYDWTFGDGSTSGAENPSHAYTQAGTKRVTLTAISADGCTDKVSQNITIYLRPIAQFEVSNTCLNDVTRFKNTSLNGSSYSWDFGDGTTSTTAQPTHTYSGTGSNTVTLTVDNANCSDVMSMNVDILDLPVSTFTTTIDGRDVDFMADATTGIAQYQWNFGDGNSGSGASTSHNYGNAVVKTFNACLKATGDNGCVSQSCDDVKIDILGVATSKLDYFEVFPNPNSGKFQVQLGEIQGDLSIEVVDLVGKTIKVVDTSVVTDNYDVDLGQVAEGVYMVVVRNGETITTKKIVVNN